jgi:hypothetical protein
MVRGTIPRGTQCLGCFKNLSQRKVVDVHVARRKGKAKKVVAAPQALQGISFEAMAKR